MEGPSRHVCAGLVGELPGGGLADICESTIVRLSEEAALEEGWHRHQAKLRHGGAPWHPLVLRQVSGAYSGTSLPWDGLPMGWVMRRPHRAAGVWRSA